MKLLGGFFREIHNLRKFPLLFSTDWYQQRHLLAKGETLKYISCFFKSHFFGLYIYHTCLCDNRKYQRWTCTKYKVKTIKTTVKEGRDFRFWLWALNSTTPLRFCEILHTEIIMIITVKIIKVKVKIKHSKQNTDLTIASPPNLE